MEFAPANIWQDFKTASRTEQGTLDDNANEVILGPRLNEAVRHLGNGYLKTLELGPETKATDERAKLLDLHWGRIEHDGAMLQGLGAAMTNFAETLGANVTALADKWKGESYDAFSTAIDKVRRTLAEYGEAATVTGDGVVNAMAQVRKLYQTFADDTADKHLNFGETSPPEFWHKVTDHEAYSGFELAENCPTTHLTLNCAKNDDRFRNMITDRFVTERRWEICKQTGCQELEPTVEIMYKIMVDECQAAIDRIKGKLDNYFGAVDTVVEGVSGLYEAALTNVYNLANAEVFSSLRVIGGGSPVDESPAGGGDVDPGPAAVAEPMPEPEPVPVEEPAPVEEPVPVAEPEAVAQEPPDLGESVQIQDGDRTIGVTGLDGEGRVRVTVADATGATKSYVLDFAAASGLPSTPASGEPGRDGVVPEEIPARTDGKCVIQDGPLTITAERPLFSPDSIKLVVDDGTGNPTTYTLDFDVPEPTPEPPVAGTAPQAWHGDQAGSVSGVLVPERPDGEAHLPRAADSVEPEVGGMAGSGLPVGVAPTSSTPGRAGSGWSVHGDLFDNGGPVYSMHGVLGDDDKAAE